MADSELREAKERLASILDDEGYGYWIDTDQLCDTLTKYADAVLALLPDTPKLLLMNDDATVTELTRCSYCGYLFRDIAKHVDESVSVPAYVEEREER